MAGHPSDHSRPPTSKRTTDFGALEAELGPWRFFALYNEGVRYFARLVDACEAQEQFYDAAGLEDGAHITPEQAEIIDVLYAERCDALTEAGHWFDSMAYLMRAEKAGAARARGRPR